MGEPRRSFLFLVFAEEFNVQSQRTSPANPARSNPVLVEKHYQFGAVCGNDSSFTNKVDLSTTNGINPKHKQEKRQSSKDARLARRHGKSTSRRRVRDRAGQHGRGAGSPCHQPTLVERVGTTHQENTTPPRDTTGPKRPKPCYPRKAAPRPSSRRG